MVVFKTCMLMMQSTKDENFKNEDTIKYEMDIITELTNNSHIKKPTKCEIYKALESMKKAKASDSFDLTVKKVIYMQAITSYIVLIKFYSSF